MRSFKVLVLLTLLAAAPVFAAEEPPRVAARPLATMHITPDTVSWEAEAGLEELELAVAGPDGAVLRRQFAAGETPSFDLFNEDGQRRPDGVYTYELRAVKELRPGRSLLLSGSVAIRDGSFVEPEALAEPPGKGPRPIFEADQVIADDLIVQGRSCIGTTCVDGEFFSGDLEVKSCSPSIMFEDTGCGVSGTHDWLVLANGPFAEESFKILNLDSGGQVFTLTGGAPAYSFYMNSSGNVGFGTSTPATRLHLYGTGIKGLIEETSSPPTDREILELRNNGNVALIFKNSAATQRWSANVGSTSFIINEQVHGGFEFNLTDQGNLTISGNLTAANFPPSSRALKENFAGVDPAAILATIAVMPVTEWSFKEDPQHRRHIGPTVEDFQAAFGLGTSGQSLVVTDVNGVALAAIKGLHQLVGEKERQISDLQRQLEELRQEVERLAKLEPR